MPNLNSMDFAIQYTAGLHLLDSFKKLSILVAVCSEGIDERDGTLHQIDNLGGKNAKLNVLNASI